MAGILKLCEFVEELQTTETVDVHNRIAAISRTFADGCFAGTAAQTPTSEVRDTRPSSAVQSEGGHGWRTDNG